MDAGRCDPISRGRQGHRRLGLICTGHTADLLKALGRGMHVFSHEVPWAGTRSNSHDGSAPTFPAVRVAVHHAGLDGLGRRSRAGAGSTDAE